MSMFCVLRMSIASTRRILSGKSNCPSSIVCESMRLEMRARFWKSYVSPTM